MKVVEMTRFKILKSLLEVFLTICWRLSHTGGTSTNENVNF